MARNFLYNPKYHIDWAWSLAIKGATDQEVADAFGVARMTIARWKKKYPDFAEALANGKKAADARVEKSLFKRCMGYDVEEEEKLIEVHKDGSSKIGTVRTKRRHIPPDTMAMMYWLNNRSRDTGEWAQVQNIKKLEKIEPVNFTFDRGAKHEP